MRKIIICTFVFLFSFAAQANQALEERMYYLNEQAELFTQICFSEDATYKEGVVHYQPSTSIRQTAYDCDAQLHALNEELDAINQIVTILPGNCEFAPEDPTVAGLLAQGAEALDAARSCPGSGGARACTSSIARNMASAFIPKAIHDFGNETNCFTTVLAGFAYSFYDMACSITSLFGYNCDGNSRDEEAASSDAATLAGVQTEPRVTRFTQDPPGWASDVFGSFVDSISESIMERFGCADWAGDPYLSTCNTPMSWSCADCGTRTNMVCGVVGYIAGIATQEVLTGFLLGAVAGLGTRAALSVSRQAAIHFPAAIRLGGRGLSFGARAAGRIGNFWRGFVATRPIRAISETSAKLAQALAAGNRQARRVIVIARGQDWLVTAIRRYNELTEQALAAGFNSTAGARLRTIQRIEREEVRVDDILDGTVVRDDGTRFRSVEEYIEWHRSGLPEEQRALLFVDRSVGDGAQERIVFSVRRDVEYNSSITLPEAPAVVAAPIVPPAPVIRAVDDVQGPDIVVTANINYQVPRSEIPAITTQLRERGIDLDNLSLPIDANVANQLNRNQRTIVLEELIGRRLSSDLADDILDEVRRGASAIDPTNFRLRRQRVIAALQEMGLTAEEAALKADELFASRLLGDVPPSYAGGAGVMPPGPRSADDLVPQPTGAGAARPSDLARAAPGRAFDFAQRESLERQLSLVVGSNPGLRGRNIDDIINEIQRGTRSMDMNPAEAGLDRFFARYNVPIADRGPIIREWDALVERRRQLTIQNVETDMQRLGARVEQRNVRCDQVNTLHPDAFLPAAGCREIRFTQRVDGEYCTCNLTDTNRLMSRAPGPWLLPCAQLGSQYNISRGQSDVSALPVKDRALNRCWKVDIEPGVVCYHGGLGPTFTGFGGEAQMNCSNRRITRDPTDTTEAWGDSTGTWTVSRYAPISDDPRMISITDAGRRCLDAAARRDGGAVCSGAGLQTIRQEVDALRRSGPNGRLTAEDINEAEMYVQYLEGRIQMDQFGNLRCLGSSELATGPCP